MRSNYISAERIDVWIGSDNDASSRKEDDDIQFDYIGFITLSNNENTKFKCRELKTITIPSVEPTKYVKLTLYQNHVNNLNAYNQVFIHTTHLKIYILSISNFTKYIANYSLNVRLVWLRFKLWVKKYRKTKMNQRMRKMALKLHVLMIWRLKCTLIKKLPAYLNNWKKKKEKLFWVIISFIICILFFSK